MTPTLQDVALLLGLPIDGHAITGDSNFDAQYICFTLLGLVPPPERLKGENVSLPWLQQQFQNGPLDNATEEVLLCHARAYILHLIGPVLFTSNTENSVPVMFLTLLQSMEQCRMYSWGSAMLAYLYRQLCRGCMMGTKQLGGCVLLLQLWSWEYINVGRPIINGPRHHLVMHNDPPLPLGAKWNAHLSWRENPRHLLYYYRDQFDFQESYQVDWQPYRNRLNTLPLICFEGQHIRRYIGPLISFDIVEMHCADRVLRQFGLVQHIPDPFDTNDSLHRIGQRGRSDENWIIYYAQWIDLWNS